MDDANYRYMDSLFLDSYKAMDSLTLYTDRKLAVAEAENAVVLPYRMIENKKLAGVAERDGSFIELSRFDALSEVDSWGGAYQTEPACNVDETVIYFGRFWKHWGHFLMDMISRMWYVISHVSNLKIVYDSTVEITGVYLDFMKLLGISEDRLLRIDQPTRFKKVIIPECSHKPGISCNVEYRNIFDKAVSSALKQAADAEKYRGKNIYFTRRMQKSLIPMELGEKEIESVFEQNNFLIIAPEQHPLAEQIAMVHLAKRVACVSGTLPHNMVFAHQGEELIIIRKTNKPNYRQVGINEMRNLKVTNVDAHISLKPVGAAGPFIIDFNQNMRDFCRDRNMKFSCSGFRQWFRRKGKILWYIPIYWKRNHGKKHKVPLFDGERFTTAESAERELICFYRKRI